MLSCHFGALVYFNSREGVGRLMMRSRGCLETHDKFKGAFAQNRLTLNGLDTTIVFANQAIATSIL